MVEGMTVEEVGAWLLLQGFDEEVEKAFKDHFMDGEAILTAFGLSSGPDCLRDVLPKYGLRVKVYKSLKTSIDQELRHEDDMISHEDSGSLYTPSRASSVGPFSPQSVSSESSDITVKQSTPVNRKRSFAAKQSSSYPSSSEGGCSSKVVIDLDSHGSTPKRLTSGVPDPFPIPEFRDVTQKNLENKTFDSSDRTYMVRVLATVLLTYVKHPSMKDCEKVAKSLVLRFSFLKEHYSWQQYIYVRCQNINRKPKGASKVEDSQPKPKRSKLDASEKHACPSFDGEVDDEASHNRNVALLKDQIAKTRIDHNNIQILMRRTFPRRRVSILDGHVYNLVLDVVDEYPVLRKPSFVAFEMELILQQDNVLGQFKTNWETYVKVILDYATFHKNPSKDLHHSLRDLHDDNNVWEESGDIGITDVQSLSCLRVLGSFLFIQSRKKVDGKSPHADIPHLLVEARRGIPPSQVMEANNNFPHIVRVIDETQDVQDKYFIAVEGTLLLECRDLVNSIFQLLSVHYVFNIQYHPKTENILLFLQEKMLGLSANGRKNPKYLSFTAAIDSFLQ